jgi:putative oxidoreductase
VSGFFAQFTDASLILLRVMVGLVFIESGYLDLKKPEERAKSIGMSKGFTLFLGFAECLGGVGVISGLLAQLAALGLILVLIGAMQKKIFVWKIGFWGQDGLGWSYESMLISMLLVILCTGGGNYIV